MATILGIVIKANDKSIRPITNSTVTTEERIIVKI